MLTWLVLALALLLLALVLYCEYKGNRPGLLVSKTALSFLFILAALIQPHPLTRYFSFLLGGLALCFVGDVCLALPQEKAFLMGLVAFLLGHVFYVCAFFSLTEYRLWVLIAVVVVCMISGWVYVWLRPHLGSMNLPVLAYVLIITLMVCGALFVVTNPAVSVSARIMILGGASAFYFSDIYVARDRFIKQDFKNRLIGLPMYYTGQFLLALSVGLIK